MAALVDLRAREAVADRFVPVRAVVVDAVKEKALRFDDRLPIGARLDADALHQDPIDPPCEPKPPRLVPEKLEPEGRYDEPELRPTQYEE